MLLFIKEKANVHPEMPFFSQLSAYHLWALKHYLLDCARLSTEMVMTNYTHPLVYSLETFPNNGSMGIVLWLLLLRNLSTKVHVGYEKVIVQIIIVINVVKIIILIYNVYCSLRSSTEICLSFHKFHQQTWFDCCVYDHYALKYLHIFSLKTDFQYNTFKTDLLTIRNNLGNCIIDCCL